MPKIVRVKGYRRDEDDGTGSVSVRAHVRKILDKFGKGGDSDTKTGAYTPYNPNNKSGVSEPDGGKFPGYSPNRNSGVSEPLREEFTKYSPERSGVADGKSSFPDGPATTNNIDRQLAVMHYLSDSLKDASSRLRSNDSPMDTIAADHLSGLAEDLDETGRIRTRLPESVAVIKKVLNDTEAFKRALKKKSGKYTQGDWDEMRDILKSVSVWVDSVDGYNFSDEIEARLSNESEAITLVRKCIDNYVKSKK